MKSPFAMTLLAACSSGGRSPAGPTEPRLLDIAKVATATVTAEDFDFLAITGGEIWITNYEVPELLRIDTHSAKISARIPLPSNACKTIAATDQAIWLGRCEPHALLRVDRSTLQVDEFPVDVVADSEAMIAVGDGAVWVVVDPDGASLARIDPSTGAVVATIPVARGSRGIALTPGAAWVTSPEANVVTRVDTTTNTAVGTIAVGPGPRFITAGEGAVWALQQGDGGIARIDPRTGTVTTTIASGVVGSGGDIDAAEGSLWVRGNDVLLVKIDPRTNVIVERFGPPSGSGAVRAANGVAWVTAHDVRMTWRIPAR